MCLSLLTSNAANDSIEPPKPTTMATELLVNASSMDLLWPHFDDMEATSCCGKRRKMSKTDSPNSSCFDVTTLIDAIHRDVDAQVEKARTVVEQASNNTDTSSYDDFDFIDISEPSSTTEQLSFPFTQDLAFPSLSTSDEEEPEAPLVKRGSLGKRSRGLERSQTFKSGLCLLAEAETEA